MNRYLSGLMTGCAVAAVGVGIVMSNNKNRRRVVKTARRAAKKTEGVYHNIKDLF